VDGDSLEFEDVSGNKKTVKANIVDINLVDNDNKRQARADEDFISLRKILSIRALLFSASTKELRNGPPFSCGRAARRNRCAPAGKIRCLSGQRKEIFVGSEKIAALPTSSVPRSSPSRMALAGWTV
jgi:hypothetical protein